MDDRHDTCAGVLDEIEIPDIADEDFVITAGGARSEIEQPQTER